MACGAVLHTIPDEERQTGEVLSSKRGACRRSVLQILEGGERQGDGHPFAAGVVGTGLVPRSPQSTRIVHIVEESVVGCSICHLCVASEDTLHGEVGPGIA